MSEIHVGDIGTKFKVTVQENSSAIDISGATVKDIIFRRPSGVSVTLASTFETNGTDGIIHYITTSSTLLSEAGSNWSFQAFITLPSGSWHSSIQNFTVHRNIST